jgi:GTP-binding protein YchF
MLTGKGEGASAILGKASTNIGAAAVPDSRVNFLSGLYRPKKTTYARIELTDISGLSAAGADWSSSAIKFVHDARNCDALIHVLRGFSSESVAHDLEGIDPARDLELVESELLFADLELADKRIDRIKAGKKITKEGAYELEVFKRCYDWLENGGVMREMRLSPQERAALNHYAFFTEKPRIAVVNLDERQWKAEAWPNRDALHSLCARLNIPLLALCAQMELEINRLPEEDKQVFLEDLGIDQPGITVLARAVYDLLSLISFLTVGEDEVKAWTIEKGTIAKHAAGKIHSDIERGFIRAEVVKFDDLKKLGSMAKVKENGLFRLEGKEYIVKDGDIINFRFNV